MTNINPSFNTINYVLDLSSIDTLNKRGIDSFLHVKNLKLPTTSDDSIIIYENQNYDAFHMKQTMIIKIRAVTYKSDRVVIVTASKIKSTNEIVDAIIELERQKDEYKINNVKITN